MPETPEATKPILSSNTQPTIVSGESSVGVGESTAYATKAEVKSLAEKQRSDQNLLLAIMAGVVIFVVVTFWLELSAMHRNYIQDKSLLLQNNQLNKDYFDKVLLLNNEIQDLKTQIEVLKARNPNLK